MKSFQLESSTNHVKFRQTASTTMQTNARHSGQLFGRIQRSQKRLNSTVQFQSPQKSKFSKLGQPLRKHFGWNKWRVSSFPIVSDTFKKELNLKIKKENKNKQEGRMLDETQIKLRHKIRQIIKVKRNIEKARQNNKLIKLIQDFQQNKINSFFDQLEQLLDSETL